jgi:hypothetical protein
MKMIVLALMQVVFYSSGMLTFSEKAAQAKSRAQKDEKTGCLNWVGALNDGYGWVTVEGKQICAHRLVFLAAEGPLKEGHQVLHRCGNRRCINLEHLYSGTPQQNVIDALNGRTWKWGKSEMKLTPEQVLDIRSRYAKGGVTQKQLGEEFGVCQKMVSFIINRERWMHI